MRGRIRETSRRPGVMTIADLLVIYTGKSCLSYPVTVALSDHAQVRPESLMLRSFGIKERSIWLSYFVPRK
jgi:hypothetical protein